MNYRPDESTLISYMYGELGEKEKERLQVYFQENPEELKKMQQLASMLGVLGKVSDKEVIAPPIFMDDPKARPLWRTAYFKAIVSIAASFLLILVAARLLVTDASYSQGELRVSFGSPKTQLAEPPVRKELSELEVQKMIDASLHRNGEAINVRLAENQKKLDAAIRRNLDANSRQIDELMARASRASELQVHAFVAGLQEKNLQSMREYLQLSAADQKRYTENLLVDFSKWLQEQRNQDLTIFQTRINSIEQNTGIFQQETEQILASIISSGSMNKTQSN